MNRFRPLPMDNAEALQYLCDLLSVVAIDQVLACSAALTGLVFI